MQPKLELLSDELVERILGEAFQILMEPGIKVLSVEVRRLLLEAGALPTADETVLRLPEALVRKAIASVPAEFTLYNREGQPAIHFGGNNVHFDPGSSGVHILDPETLEHRPSQSADLIRIVKLTEMMPQYDAQSTAVVCNEIPKQIGDLYRLYLVLLYSKKPIITGAFTAQTTQAMIDMLAVYAGGSRELARKPIAVFDVCPTPPLIWSPFGAQNLIDLARAGVPAEIVSMPLAGVGGPVTLVGSVVQHAAECLSGMTIHQLANPGAPVIWGGAPAIMDMRQGTTPMGAIETAMIDASYAQVGKALGFPTHAYLGASDAKLVDAQAGLESGITAVLGALAGINMISGAGMLDFLACFSPEKLVVDAEAIGMAKRLLGGVRTPTETLATAMFAGLNFKADFLKQKVTKQLFAQEQYLPSPVIDRGSIRTWQQSGGQDTFARARHQAASLEAAYQRPAAPPEVEAELHQLVAYLAHSSGIETLPALDL
jgi:trimethylamine---corrinoid protein Co-methyltransferase